jgi:hypothetical protein
VDLVWYSHYSDKVPHASKKAGSFWWRDIWSLSWQFRGVSKCIAGNGSSILFWKDRWSEHGLLGETFSRIFSFAVQPDISLQKVIQLNTELHTLFYLPLSEQAFQELQAINGIVLSVRMNANQLELHDSWTYCYNSGLFSSANYYKVMFQGVIVQPIFPKLWKCKCVPKMKVFTWLMDRLNTRDMMLRRHWHLQSGPHCVMCSNGTLETRDHLFIDCPFAKRCWDFCKIIWQSGESMSDIFMNARREFQGPNFLEITICAAWNIWMERNGLIF